MELKARTRRAGKGSARQSRREGWIPAVLYGRRVGSVPVEVPAPDLFRQMGSGLGTGTVVRLLLEEEDGTQEWTTVVKEVQRDPVTLRVLHLDLQQVSLQDVLEVEVPVVLRGQEEVSRRGGIIQHQLHKVRVVSPVTAIPTDIEVDVSGLEIGQHLSVADLVLPPGVKAAEEPDEVVVTVLAPKREEERAEAEGEAAEQATEQAPDGGAA